MRLHRIAPLLTALPALAAPPPGTGALGAQQQTIERRYALNADGAVRIHNLIGSVRVVGWDKDSLVLTATLASGLRLFSGGARDGVKMGVEQDQTSLAQSVDFVVQVPARARVVLRGAATDVDVSGFAGEIDVSTTSGRVKIQGTPREVTAETIGGDLEIAASPGYLRAKTATGRITWSGSSDDVALTTVSGRITATGGTVTRARFESIDGDIRFTGGLTRTASVACDTHSGDVVLALSKDTNAELQVSAAWSDLFGRQYVSKGEPTTRGTMYHAVGKPAMGGATIVVRSFKGRVTAQLQ